MAHQLWLLRHAEAEPHGSREDFARALTGRGEQQAVLAGRALQRIGVSFQSILASPKVRARQTAELALAELAGGQRGLLALHAPLAGGFDGAQAVAAMASLDGDGCLLLVGHEPDMSQVLYDLSGVRADVKKGGVAMVRMRSGASGELALLLRPRELALMAG